ncbi:MAG: MarR family winged helix-turn-helix transcriptional regulator [Candidatus Nanopelagicales bacterium]
MSRRRTPEPRWLDAEERAAWVRLAGVVELLPAALDAQLRRDADLTHFEYWVLSMLSEAEHRTLRMTALAERTNASLSRLSHVVSRLEDRGLVERFPCPEDKRATNARLTAEGWDKVVETAPGHLAAVRHYVIDGLSREQLGQLAAISNAILENVDPERRITGPLTADS